jgi:hypothetical protein
MKEQVSPLFFSLFLCNIIMFNLITCVYGYIYLCTFDSVLYLNIYFYIRVPLGSLYSPVASARYSDVS